MGIRVSELEKMYKKQDRTLEDLHLGIKKLIEIEQAKAGGGKYV